MRKPDRLAVLLGLAFLLPACEETGPDTHIGQLGAMWMEWRAQVQEGQPLSVLIVGDLGCAAEYVRHYEVDQSNRAIVFNPYAIVSDEPCSLGIVPELFSDTIDVSDLRAGTYQLQSRDRVFGEVVVTSDPPDAPPLVGAGAATFVRDPDGCFRLRPAAYFFAHMLPLEDQADTTASWTDAFVTGHIIEATSPVCGVTRIFHLVSKN